MNKRRLAMSAIGEKQTLRCVQVGNAGGGRVLWVDYESAVSIHPVSTDVRSERRAERLASHSPDDNRITHGCINVARSFFDAVVRPTFEAGGASYILPDEATLTETFPGFVRSGGRFASPQRNDGRARPARR